LRPEKPKKPNFMKNLIYLFFLSFVIVFAACNSPRANEPETNTKADYAGFTSKIEWGEHLVKTMGCADCHSPKIMTAHGPEPDENLWLSGHPADRPLPNIDRAMAEKNMLFVSDMSLTAFIGPWGVSFGANLTPDKATGIGTWSEENFFRALREGKYKGLPDSRMILPPMPWFNFALLKDEELSAMFAYLQSITPIENAVPGPEQPLSASQPTAMN
jgi:hypothetical protein